MATCPHSTEADPTVCDACQDAEAGMREFTRADGTQGRRPEWVNCIASGVGRATLCGRSSEAFEWRFESLDHAKASAASGSRLVACADCMAAKEDD